MPNFYYEEFDSREHSRAASPCRQGLPWLFPTGVAWGVAVHGLDSVNQAESTASAPATLAIKRSCHRATTNDIFLDTDDVHSHVHACSPFGETALRRFDGNEQSAPLDNASTQIQQNLGEADASIGESNATRVWSKNDFQEILVKLKKLGEEQDRQSTKDARADSIVDKVSDQPSSGHKSVLQGDPSASRVESIQAGPFTCTPALGEPYTSGTVIRKSYATQAWSRARSREMLAELEKEWVLDEESASPSPPRAVPRFKLNDDWNWDFPKEEKGNPQVGSESPKTTVVDELPWMEGEVMSIYHYVAEADEEWFGTVRSEGDAKCVSLMYEISSELSRVLADCIELLGIESILAELYLLCSFIFRQPLELPVGELPMRQEYLSDTVRTAPAAFDDDTFDSSSAISRLETLSRIDSPTSDLEFNEIYPLIEPSTVTPGLAPYFTYTAPFPPPKLRIRNQPSTAPYLDLLVQLQIDSGSPKSDAPTGSPVEQQNGKLRVRMRDDSSLLNASARVLPKEQQKRGKLDGLFEVKGKTYASLQAEIGEKFWELQARKDGQTEDEREGTECKSAPEAGFEGVEGA